MVDKSSMTQAEPRGKIYMKYITELKVKRKKIYTIGKDIQQLNR